MCATNQGFYGTTTDKWEGMYTMRPNGAVPLRMLEFNRPAHSPWLTVPLAQEEIAIQQVNAEHCFTDEYGCEVIRG